MQVTRDEIPFMSDRVQNSQLIFDGYIVQLYLNRILLDNGMEVERELIHHKPAVCVLAVTSQQKVVLVKQYRPAVNAHILELPAGILDKGDEHDPMGGAKRELEEETAYAGENWRFLHKFYVSPGFLDEALYLFEARQLERVENPLPQDDDEDIEVVEFTKDEARTSIAKGEIIDLKTLFALHLWLSEGE